MREIQCGENGVGCEGGVGDMKVLVRLLLISVSRAVGIALIVKSWRRGGYKTQNLVQG